MQDIDHFHTICCNHFHELHVQIGAHSNLLLKNT